MKLNNHRRSSWLTLLVSLAFLAGCEEKENGPAAVADDNLTTGNPLGLDVSGGPIVLAQSEWDKDAVTFTWNPGRDRGMNTTLTYLFKMDIAGNDFNTAIPSEEIWSEEIENGKYKKTFTHKELNDIITKNWRDYLGGEIILSVRVIAKVISQDKFVKPDYSTLDFSVKSYIPASVPLYLIGSATPAQDDLSAAIPMTEVENGDVYKWRGTLTPGGYKFLFSRDGWLPSYNKGEDDHTLVKRESASDPDNLFPVGTEDHYAIVLRNYQRRVDCQVVKFPRVIFVGDATGWEFQEMEWSPDEPDTFVVTARLGEGTFKFLDAADWGASVFKPTMENAPITHEDLQYTSEYHPDWKWKITAGDVGTYKISLDTKNLKMKAKKIN